MTGTEPRTDAVSVCPKCGHAFERYAEGIEQTAQMFQRHVDSHPSIATTEPDGLPITDKYGLLRDLSEAATPGRWFERHGLVHGPDGGIFFGDNGEQQSNARLAAYSVNAVRRALATTGDARESEGLDVERLRAELVTRLGMQYGDGREPDLTRVVIEAWHAAENVIPEPDWALVDGSLAERLTYARDQHALAAGRLTLPPQPSIEEYRDWHRACAGWYDEMLDQLAGTDD